MSPRLLAITLILLLVLGEVGLGVWRNAGIDPSTAPVFSFPPAEARFNKPGELAGVIEAYHADRGAECKWTTPAGLGLTVLYFEWDQVSAGPMLSFVGHSPDQCNVAIGYDLESIDPPRTHEVSGQPPLTFDCTRFSDGSGQKVFMYKMAWIQGLGSWDLREGSFRGKRLGNSFIRHIGDARVLQAGVFGAQDSDQAWQAFQEEVLSKLVWQAPTR